MGEHKLVDKRTVCFEKGDLRENSYDFISFIYYSDIWLNILRYIWPVLSDRLLQIETIL